MEFIALAIGFGIVAAIAVALMVEEQSKREKARETAAEYIDVILTVNNPHASKEEQDRSYINFKRSLETKDDDIAQGLHKLMDYSEDKFDSITIGNFARKHIGMIRKSMKVTDKGTIGLAYIGNAVEHHIIPDEEGFKDAKRVYRKTV